MGLALANQLTAVYGELNRHAGAIDTLVQGAGKAPVPETLAANVKLTNAKLASLVPLVAEQLGGAEGRAVAQNLGYASERISWLPHVLDAARNYGTPLKPAHNVEPRDLQAVLAGIHALHDSSSFVNVRAGIH